MCANMEIYNKVRSVPADAKKAIQAGRLKGKTDINPMWRIKKLTEIFGVCGFGWKTKITGSWLEPGADGEVSAHVKVELYVRDPETKEWSEAIEGLGGSMYITNEKGGKYTDDDCFKKAYTDAISIACKALGFAADVYYEKDISKYDARNVSEPVPFPEVEKKAAPVVTPPNPATLKSPEKTSSEPPKASTPSNSPTIDAERQAAVNFVVMRGKNAGFTLGQLYKTDRAAYNEYAQFPESAEMAKAIKIINEWVGAR